MDKQQTKERLQALLIEANEFTYDSLPKEFSGYPAIPHPEWRTWVNRVENAVKKLCKDDSAPFQRVNDGLRHCETIRGNGQDVFDRAKNYLIQSLQLALKALDEDFFNELDEPRVVEIPAMKVTREGVFFAGQYYDAFQRVAEIISGARRSLTIIDAYIDDKVLGILSSKESAVTVSVLTSKVSPALQTAALNFNKQYGGLVIRTSRAFHDRFVVVDDSDFYHFGASIKDLGNRGFMFSLIEEPDVIESLRRKFSQEWATATVVI